MPITDPNSPPPQSITNVGLNSAGVLVNEFDTIDQSVDAYRGVAAGQVVYARASSAATVSSNSGALAVGLYSEPLILANVSALTGTTPTIQFALDVLGANDGVWYQVWQGAAVNAVGTVSTTIGTGAATNTAFGNTVRLRWTITGTTPSVTFSANVFGK